ncbi:MAG: hypothetical protein JNN03_19965 [Rubrivivax sp.]|nr:hypothetical protein [Rubrivivax sp.]
MKLVVKYLKPRNPFVALSLARKAGAHRPGRRARRRLIETDCRREAEQRFDPGP